MQTDNTKKSVFVITGMHRSGTSLLASLLQSAGVDIGKRLMPPGEGNVKGYFENLDFTDFHEEALSCQGISKNGWTLEKQIKVPEQLLERAKVLAQGNSAERLWGWKDPRTTLFLNFWASLIPESKFLLIYRAPWEVIDSLYRRRNLGDEVFDFNPNFALQIWQNYNQEVLNFYENFSDRCLLINVYSIVNNPDFLVTAIKEKFGVLLNNPASDIYDKSLLNTYPSSSHRPALIKHFFPGVWEIYQELNTKAVATDEISEALISEPPSLPSYDIWVLQDWLNVRKLEKESSKLQTQLEQIQDELERDRAQLQETVQQTQSQLVQVHSQLHQTQVELARSQSQLQQTQSQLQQTQSQLEHSQSHLRQTQYHLEQSLSLISGMESSKFWKLRTAWIGLRRSIGLTKDSNSGLRLLLFRLKHLIAVLKLKGLRYVLAKIIQVIYYRLYKSAPSNEVLAKLLSASSPSDELYYQWLNNNLPREADLRKMAETVEVLGYKPVISIIMPVFNTPERFLREAIESVLNQVYPYWELCIADDASTQPHVRPILEEYTLKDKRIKTVFRNENGHISRASNSAMEIATGKFLALLDHDDLLTPDALYEVALLVNRHSDADMIYSDEDKIDENNHLRDPFFKPDWCPDSFLSRMYTSHLGIYRRSLVNEIGGFRVGYEGSQDYDLVLRLTEKTGKIFHIPKVLYHWRIHSESTAKSLDSKSYANDTAQKAISDALQRRGESGKVIPVPGGHYIVRYEIKDFKLVSIIIPTRDLGNVLDKCLTSIFEKTKYPNYEVLVIDNGSTESKTLEIINNWKAKEPNRFKCERLDIPFNYSKINNYAAKTAKGEYLLFLNNDTEVLTHDWIDAMVEQAQRPCIGAVGALLLYPDNTIQHAGVVRVGGVAGHSHKHYPGDAHGYYNQIQTVNNYSIVTGACLMCRREVFEEVGGLEEELPVALNDVDLCLKILEKGYRNIYLPHVKLYHYESKSRGYEDTPEKQARFTKEIQYMQSKWKKFLEHDSCYSPNLTREREDYSINV
jgi:O-antigen biosynthesis protein